MIKLKGRALIYGYGNPGREDDGLGIEMVKNGSKTGLTCTKLDCMTTDSNYQLNIEDAEKISEWDIVVFVDASKDEDLHEFICSKVESSDAKVEFTMHAVSPAYVLHLSQKLFNKSPETYVMGIKGYEWDFKDGNTGNGETISHTFSSIGSYKVELTVTDNKGATTSNNKNYNRKIIIV